PILVGARLVIVPAWMESPDPNRVAIKIDPGMAFGTGTHPTTQLCLELIEKAITVLRLSNKEFRMIDIGCGSGILSIAALKLGATSALGVDIDSGSILNARENAQTNGLGDELILGVGSVQDILDRSFPFHKSQLVVANILAPVIIRLFDAGLADLMEKGGGIILSGILQEQAQGVIEAAQAKGLRLNEQKQIGDWVALTMS
ncbi:MAG TPA: 50S ribosomal protein L11 methyltransferase, partial [Anaerolineales bacterium]|nr:50S ribosomal protein L11 methyltransferase [Anaerolineales bacterium]